MKSFRQDLKYSTRALLKTPVFAITAIITLALGIGANTAIFSVVHAVLLQSLPYNEAENLVVVWGVTRGNDNKRSQVSFTDVADFRTQNSVFEDIANFTSWRPILSGAGESERVSAMQVGDGYFKVMKAEALLGRTFTPEEQQDGKDFVVVLGYGLWQRRFGGDQNIVGKTIELNKRAYTIVGVMPQSFQSLPTTLVNETAELYRPVAEAYDNTQRDAQHLRAIARLKQGVTLEQAQVELTTIAQRLEQSYPDTNTGHGVNLVTLTEDTIGGLRRVLFILFGAVVFVLLIACANVANLLLTRAVTRQKELAIRAALGASRGRLIRQLLTESLLLSLSGGLVGALLAWWGVGLLETLGTQIFPPLAQVKVNLTVLLFTIFVSLITGFVFGLIPALQMSQLNVNQTLKESGRTTSLSRHRLHSGLVIAEIALSLILLVCAGLLIKTIMSLQNVNPGFNSENLLTMQIGLPFAKYPEEKQRTEFFRQLDERIKAIPGVESAGFTSVLPLSKNFDRRGLYVESKPVPTGQEPSADMYIVTPDFINMMQIRLLNGRLLTAQDKSDSQLVVLINEKMAGRLWNNEDPINKRISLSGGTPDTPPRWRTVVGVVNDIKQYGLDKDVPMQFYVPQEQFGAGFMSLVVRTKNDPTSLTASIRNEIFAYDKEQPAYDIKTMNQLIDDRMSLRRFTMFLLGLFATIALLLATVGIYGVISYAVTQRQHEIGVRMALGAQRSDILRMVVGQGLKLVLIGIGIGLIAVFALTRLLKSLLFDVSPRDPLTFVLISLLLMFVALIACYVPARRATKTDPIVALRYE